MTISGILSALLVGLVVGALARLILPGRQAIGLLATIAVGIVAALLGTWLTNEMGIGDVSGYDLIELIVQVGLAVIGVGLVAGTLRRSRSRT
ncbi:MAG: GlsB/YeaQ/YmgE family stress response membrane protein [Actinophytocola sp.]|nr:GlsB/YeaQ/YmgE family stress response membrane protein [Actinophytocola sp.]